MPDLEMTHILSDRERNVLTLRFGIDGGRSLTLGDVGKGLDCTRERVRQIEAKAIRKIKQLALDPTTGIAILPICCDACFKVAMDIADIPGVMTPTHLLTD